MGYGSKYTYSEEIVITMDALLTSTPPSPVLHAPPRLWQQLMWTSECTYWVVDIYASCLAYLMNSSPPPPSRVIYKLHGPDADTNGTLTPEVKAQLDGLSLEEVVAQIKATGGKAFSAGKSAYRGVSWHKKTQTWRVQMTTGNGQKLKLYKHMDSELEAARQYDAWCKQYGR
jgi:hypothetical protein